MRADSAGGARQPPARSARPRPPAPRPRRTASCARARQTAHRRSPGPSTRDKLRDRLRDAQHLALLLRPGAARDQAVQRRLHRPHAEAPAGSSTPAAAPAPPRAGKHQQPDRDQPEPAEQQPLLAEPLGQRPDRAALHQRQQHPDIGEDIADLGAAPSRIAASPTARTSPPFRRRRGSRERRPAAAATGPAGRSPPGSRRAGCASAAPAPPASGSRAARR